MTKFEGIFILATPLHCSAGVEKIDKKSVNRTMTQAVFTGAGGMDTVPYYPASGLRGRLRDEAGTIILDAITAREPINRTVYAGVMTGMEGGQPDTTLTTVEEILRQRNNIFMALFGGGARMLKSNYRVDDLVPVLTSTISAGMVPSHFGERTDESFMPTTFAGSEFPTKGKHIIEIRNSVRIDDVLKVTNFDRMDRYMENAVESIKEYQDIVDANKKARSEEKEADADEKAGKDDTKKVDAANMMSYEVISAGVPLYFNLEIDGSLQKGFIGLMALAVCNMVNKQNLGGIVRNGHGRYLANLKMVSEDGESPLLVKENGRYVVAGEAAGYLEDMRTMLEALTAKDMQSFYQPRVSAADKEAKAAAKAIAKAKKASDKASGNAAALEEKAVG